MEKNKIDNAIIDNFHVDEEGVKTIKTIDIANLTKLGVEDVSAFLNGLLDAENDEEFKESSPDYIKGYKYGKTGTF